MHSVRETMGVADVQYTIDTFKKIKERLAAGEYQHEGIVNWA